MYKLSIIVPVYNMAGDGKLEYCLNSLLNQTISDYEIIAVDDKSTDNSLEVLRSFEEKYPDKFQVVESQENGRQGAARNKGLAVAKGEFIAFIDSDDWVLPDTYECALKKAEETGADVVGFDICIIHEHSMVPTAPTEKRPLDKCGVIDHDKKAYLLLNAGSVCTKIYRRGLLCNPPFLFPEKMAYEDNAITVNLVNRIKHFEFIPEVKYFYYMNNSSTTHSVTQKNIDDRMKAMRILLNDSKELGILDEFPKEIEFLYATRFYSTTLFSYMQSDIKHSVKFIKELYKEIKKEFPDFMENEFFLDVLDEEQKKWLKMQQSNSTLFYCYYKFKKWYRMKRYGRW